VTSHAPEVLRDLALRLRGEVYRTECRWRAERGELGPEAHELTREDVEAAHRGGVLEIDRALTLELARAAAARGSW